MSHWNHRVIKHVRTSVIDKIEETETWFSVHEVYYDDAGHPNGYTEDAVEPFGETLLELADDLDRFQVALSKPVLVHEDFFPREGSSHPRDIEPEAVEENRFAENEAWSDALMEIDRLDAKEPDIWDASKPLPPGRHAHHGQNGPYLCHGTCSLGYGSATWPYLGESFRPDYSVAETKFGPSADPRPEEEYAAGTYNGPSSEGLWQALDRASVSANQEVVAEPVASLGFVITQPEAAVEPARVSSPVYKVFSMPCQFCNGRVLPREEWSTGTWCCDAQWRSQCDEAGKLGECL